MRPIYRSYALVAAAVLVAMLPTRRAAAQGSTTAYGFVGGPLCGSVTPQAAASFSCSGNGSTVVASAFATAGKVGGSISAVAMQAVPGPSATIGAVWRDVLRVTGGPALPASVRIGLSFDGYFDLNLLGPGGLTSSATFAFDNAVGGSFGASVTQGAGPSAVVVPVNWTRDVDVPLTAAAGGAWAPFELRFTSEFAAYGPYTGAPISGTALNAFSSTGKATSLTFLDAAGRPLATPVTYTFDNGTVIYSATPEPATVALVAAGLLALGGAARRVRRTA